MLKRFAPLVPIALTVFLAACAGHAPQTQPQQPISDAAVEPVTRLMIEQDEPADDEINALIDDQPYEMPQLADSLLDLGRSLIGTRYRYGGSSVQSGFDCSGFIGYLFREEVGLELPRSTRELINLEDLCSGSLGQPPARDDGTDLSSQFRLRQRLRRPWMSQVREHVAAAHDVCLLRHRSTPCLR